MSLPDTIDGYVLAPDEGEALWVNSALGIIKATAAQTQGRFAAIEFRMPVGFGPPLHRHKDDDEFFLVLAGDVRLQLGERMIEGEPGTLVYSPRGVPHAFRADSEDARVLLLFGPAGVEGFFREAGTAAQALTLPPPGGPVRLMEEVLAIATSYGQEFIGPPLPAKE